MRYISENQEPILLFGADTPWSGTGFGNMANFILSSMQDKLECHQIGWQHYGAPITFNKWVVHAGGPELDRHNYGSITIPEFVETHPNVKLLMTLQDIHTLDYIPKIKDRPAWLPYFPVDTHDFQKKWVDIAASSEYPTTYSKFGQQVLEKMDLDAYMIYHGVDTKLFRPMNKDISRNNMKSKLQIVDRKGRLSNLANKFVVGFVGRFNKRKMPLIWLSIFREFARDKPDVMAYWHCDPLDPMAMECFNLGEMLHAMQIEDKFIHSTQYKWWRPVDPNFLAGLYNIMDVHLYPTGGEGFGLTIAESMASGVPNLVTDYTTGPEFLRGPKGRMRGELLPVETWIEMDTIKRPWVSIKKGVELLNRLYEDEQLRKLYSCRSRQWAKTIDWETKIKPQMIRHVEMCAGV